MNAQCAVHAEAASIGSCARCGAFRCEACSFGEVCRACVGLALRSLPSTRGVANAAVASLWGVGLCQLFLLVPQALMFALFLATGRGSPMDFPFIGLGKCFTFMVWLVTVTTFLVWEYRTLRRATVMRVGPSVSPGLVLVSWFVPIANLVVPRRHLQMLATALLPAEKPNLWPWWLCWSGSLFCSLPVLFLPSTTSGAVFELAADVLFLVATPLGVRLIHTVVRGLHANEVRVLG